MKPVIRSLTLRGFRSFESERVEFSNPTFLVGRNAVGKSNLIDALAFLQEAMGHPLDEVIRRRGGVSSLVHRGAPVSRQSFGLRVELGGGGIQDGFYSIEIQANQDHSFEVTQEQCKITTRHSHHWFSRDHKSFSSNLEGLQPELDPQFLLLPLLGLHSRFQLAFKLLYFMTVFKAGTDLMRRPQKAERSERLLADWSNAANVLRFLEEKFPDTVERISEILSVVTPEPMRVTSRLQGGMVSLEFEQQHEGGSKDSFDATEISDGTLQVLGLLLAVFQRPLPVRTLMIFEEPEAFLYSGILTVATDLLNAASDENQVLVTTHSADLLDAKWITDRHIRILFWENNSSRVSEVGKASRETLREGLMQAGELLRSNVLDSPPIRRTEIDTHLFEALS
jgi:predicted ATPase